MGTFLIFSLCPIKCPTEYYIISSAVRLVDVFNHQKGVDSYVEITMGAMRMAT